MTVISGVVDIYTDGACSPNPGPGGWGALVLRAGAEHELCGGQAATTTNNRMELTAPIRALESLPQGSTVRLYTDSVYVRDGITRWMVRWKVNGWRTAGRQPVKNADLWRLLEAAVSRHDVRWHWVKGHAGHPGNERADRLAARGMARALADPSPAAPSPAAPSLAASSPVSPAAAASAAASPPAEPPPTLF